MACEKKRYATAVAAGQAIQHFNKRIGVEYQRMYLCPFCKGWHLTTQEQRRQSSAGRPR